MGGYATRVNRFLFLTLSLMVSVTTPLLFFRYASGPVLYSALSHLSVRPAPLCPLPGWSPETINTWHARGTGLARSNPRDPSCIVEDVQDAGFRGDRVRGRCEVVQGGEFWLGKKKSERREESDEDA